MKKVLKWIGIGLLILIGIIIVGGAVGHFVGKNRLNKAPDVATEPVAVPTDAEAIARGEHLVNAVSSCRLCHGDNLEGQVFIEGEMGVFITAPNLTSGAGGIGAAYNDADWERAIRHGIGGDGRTLVIMPSYIYSHYSDEDLGALIAYLKSVPPVDNDMGQRRIGFPGSILGGFVAYNDFASVGKIDHASVGGTAPAEGPTAEYGHYLTSVAMCGECHGSNLAGVPPGGDGPPPGPNLTPGGELSGWNEEDFMNTIRTGQTPDGETLDSEEMPWPSFSQMSDTELQAIWAYLSSLEPLPDNS